MLHLHQLGENEGSKRKVAAILHVDKDHKDQVGYINVQQENPWDIRVR